MTIDSQVRSSAWLSADDVREFFAERAAIAEFEGRLPPYEAEALALERTAQFFALRAEVVCQLLNQGKSAHD